MVSRNVYFLRSMLFVQHDAHDGFVDRRGVIKFVMVTDILRFRIARSSLRLVQSAIAYTIRSYVFVPYSEWSQKDDHGWKRYQSSWQPDTGYNDDAPLSHLPMRTFGDTDYHSVTMRLDLHTEDFTKECSQGLEVFYVNIYAFNDRY